MTDHLTMLDDPAWEDHLADVDAAHLLSAEEGTA